MSIVLVIAVSAVRFRPTVRVLELSSIERTAFGKNGQSRYRGCEVETMPPLNAQNEFRNGGIARGLSAGSVTLRSGSITWPSCLEYIAVNQPRR